MQRYAAAPATARRPLGGPRPGRFSVVPFTARQPLRGARESKRYGSRFRAARWSGQLVRSPIARRRRPGGEHELPAPFHLPDALELGGHVGPDLLHHRLVFRIAVQRLQIRLLLEPVPPVPTPALVDGLAKGGERLLPLTVERVELDIGDPGAEEAEAWPLLDRLDAALEEPLRPLPLAGPEEDQGEIDGRAIVPEIDLGIALGEELGKERLVQGTRLRVAARCELLISQKRQVLFPVRPEGEGLASMVERSVLVPSIQRQTLHGEIREDVLGSEL